MEKTKCTKCKGKGYVMDSTITSRISHVCSKCKGVGKLDWIEQVLGKKSLLRGRYYYEFSLYSAGSSKVVKV